MRTRVRAAMVVVIVAHGLVHLLGTRLTAGAAAAWLAAAVLLAAAGVLLAVGSRWWWVVGAVAVALSQGLILTSWSDARAGSAVNVVVLVAVLYGFASQGPTSPRAEYRRRAGEAVAEVVPDGRVMEADLVHCRHRSRPTFASPVPWASPGWPTSTPGSTAGFGEARQSPG